MTEVHLVPDMPGTEEMHALDRSCWCEPEQTDGEWDDQPATVFDHRPTREGDHGVFVYRSDAVPLPVSETLPTTRPPGG
jgi:hypothetical protein